MKGENKMDTGYCVIIARDLLGNKRYIVRDSDSGGYPYASKNFYPNDAFRYLEGKRFLNSITENDCRYMKVDPESLELRALTIT